MEILPFLYLGSAYHASRKDMLDMLGITALINVSANCPNHFEDSFLYKSIPVEDNHKADISSWFNEAIEFIGEYIHHSCSFNCQVLSGHRSCCLPVDRKKTQPPPPLPSAHSLTPGFKFEKVPSKTVQLSRHRLPTPPQ